MKKITAEDARSLSRAFLQKETQEKQLKMFFAKVVEKINIGEMYMEIDFFDANFILKEISNLGYKIYRENNKIKISW